MPRREENSGPASNRLVHRQHYPVSARTRWCSSPAARAVGRPICRGVSALGARVAVLSRSAPRVNELSRSIGGGDRVLGIAAADIQLRPNRIRCSAGAQSLWATRRAGASAALVGGGRP